MGIKDRHILGFDYACNLVIGMDEALTQLKVVSLEKGGEMTKYNCILSFEHELVAEDREEAMEKFMDMLDSLADGWMKDNTEITKI